MSLYARLKPPGPSGFGYGSTAQDVVERLDLTGRTILLTGCNSGVGFEAMRALAGRGATVIAAARTRDKAREAGSKVKGTIVPVECELSEPGSVRAAVAEVAARPGQLDAIICNAGIMALPKLTLKHGYELQFLTNHIGHFLLTTGLLHKLAPTGRVVVLASDAHRGASKQGIEFDNLRGEKSYSGWRFYGQSKLANILFAKQLAKHFGSTGQVANAVHPGVIDTNLARYMNPMVDLAYKVAAPLALKNIPQGAATETWAAVHPDAARVNGEYLADCNVAKPRRLAEDAQLAERLWQKSEEICAQI